MTLLLFAAVPLLMGGYLVVRHFAEQQPEERQLEPWDLAVPSTPATTPRPWVERDPPSLELAAVRPDASGGLIAYVRTDGGVRVVTPKGEFVAGIDGFDADYSAGTVRLSRDRTRLSVLVHDRQRARAEQAQGNDPGGEAGILGQGVFGEVLVYDLTRPGPPLARIARGQRGDAPVWGKDNNALYLHRFEWVSKKTWKQREVWERFDLTTNTATPLALPPHHHLYDVSPDGKTLLTTEYAPTDTGGRVTSYLMDPVTLDRKRATDARVSLSCFSPDGTRAAGFRLPERRDEEVQELVVVNLADGTASTVKVGDDDTLTMWGPIWSADGTRLAVRRTVLLPGEKRRQPTPGAADTTPSRFESTLRKLDGSDPQPFPAVEGIYWFDWR